MVKKVFLGSDITPNWPEKPCALCLDFLKLLNSIGFTDAKAVNALNLIGCLQHQDAHITGRMIVACTELALCSILGMAGVWRGGRGSKPEPR